MCSTGRTGISSGVPAVAPASGGAPLAAMARLLTQATNQAQAHPAATAQSSCAKKDAGLFSDPSDCACFYACDGLGGGIRACCTATIFWRCFNSQLRWCDLCANVEECAEGSAPDSGPPPITAPGVPPSPAVEPAAQPPSPSEGAPSPPIGAPETHPPVSGPPASPPQDAAPPPLTGQTPPSLSAPPPVSGIGKLRTMTYWGQPGVAVNSSDSRSLAKVSTSARVAVPTFFYFFLGEKSRLP